MLSDNSLKPLAFLTSAHQYAYAHDWKPPREFVDAFHRDYPDKEYKWGTQGKPDHGFGMLWVDKNGDGKVQSDEIEFSTAATNFAGSGWSHDYNDLTLRVPATVGGRSVLVVLRPEGWWPSGAPKYPPLNASRKSGPPDRPASRQQHGGKHRGPLWQPAPQQQSHAGFLPRRAVALELPEPLGERPRLP